MNLRSVISIASLTGAIFALPAAVRAQDSGIQVGTQAPAAAVETLDGKPANLSQYIGKAPVLMEFWATCCPKRRELEPHLKAVHARYASQVKFVGVSVSVNQ